MTTPTAQNPNQDPALAANAEEPPFGANELRLNARQWLTALVIVLAVLAGVPRLWERIERFTTGPDYRIPYALSSDYWLYHRRVAAIPATAIPVLGDSVVWGEYVRPDSALPHFLSVQAGQPGAFANCGVNGLFPLSLEGLVGSYAGPLRNRKVLLHCNMLWMSSPKADLSTDKEETFNHASLVPQFFPRIPCYRADANARLSAMAGRSLTFCSWVGHLDSVYFDQQSIPRWTLADDGSDPPRYPNTWRNPLARINLVVPGEPRDDPLRGPNSSRHKPWNAGGKGAPTHFDWVPLNASLQWHAFQRAVALLRARGNDVCVILGPFNESMVAEDERATYRQMRDGIAAWLTAQGVAHVAPEALPSEMYADASHPLTQGYELLAGRIWEDKAFQQWLGPGQPGGGIGLAHGTAE